MLKMVKPSGKFLLGKKYAGKFFEVEAQLDGSFILKPMLVIPETDFWLHTAEMQAKLTQAEQWMQHNPPRETDLESLIHQSEELQ